MKKEMPFFQPKKKETFNLKQEVLRYTKHWKWFLISVVILLFFAFFSIKKSPVVYETSARIKILNQQVNNIELPGNLNSLFEEAKVNLENEIEIIKSYRILEKVSESLDLNVRYYHITASRLIQVWDIPLKAYPINNFTPLPTSGEYIVQVLENGYIIKDSNSKEWKVSEHTMNVALKDLPFLLKIDALRNTSELINKKIKIRFFTTREATLRLFSGLNIEHIGKSSEILKISLRNESSAKSEAILNEIIAQFNQDGLTDRKLIFQRTIDFVDERFEFLTKELDSIENKKKQFKQKNKLTDIVMDTEHNLSDKSNSNTEKVNLETQLEIARILRKTLTNKNNSELLPVDIGLGIAGVNDQITLFNKKLLEYNKLKISGGENNPLVKNLNKDINQLKNNIFTSVVAYQKKSETALNNIKIVDRKNKGFFTALPTKEKILREIEREQSIKENLFIFLLQRREEAAINLVITAPTLKVVDYAITNLIPVSESPKMVYLKAFIAGLVIPFIVFYLIFFLDTRIQTREDLIANITTSQVIGAIPFSEDKKLFSGKDDNSILAEGFRMLRTNIGYVFKNQPEKELANVIMVTSTKEGEGKTFCAINLAISYAVLNKKVLLLDTNFRKPEIQNYLKSERNSNKGLSDYLQGDFKNFKDLISSFRIGKTVLDILTTGEIPNAPAELLANEKLEELINSLKDKYDYIILDTTPTSVVTDTLLISEMADLTIYVAKSNFTNKKTIAFAEELVGTNKLNNVSYILNAV
ncbi:polysaccharide biosynthesis tyrosine autokinase [Polaribacter vadi]|uniref:polysaccharide biosynthesis tyrosine autokinase n=1 Tax=Polaribacter TaxID=52959 RepID=UPI001C08FB47|nr:MULTISPECIES: tyrosine-protein kinase family protein [Polaribacter]MBU3010513.1 polysaccharide biosynthesis tyrosine autokinase [Polaribacter vadi]MDO6740321.1 polysaccharide biosynthesis tyrosine autokinase [Polaribacter sp. 1_MG-2023]